MTAALSERVGRVVGYPPLSEMDERQRREFQEALLEAASFEDLPGKWQAAILEAEQNRPKLRVVRKWFQPDWDLDDAEEKAGEKLIAGGHLEAERPSIAASRSVDELVRLAERVLQAENDRETSLNGRGATLAAVAGIIVSLSGFVADLLIAPTSTAGEASGTLTSSETYVAVCMFVAALALLIVAIAISVLRVLRPARGKMTRAFLGDAIVRLLL